jgi:DNA-binding transcriptional LysR family regulator
VTAPQEPTDPGKTILAAAEPLGRKSGEITLHQLRIFWAVARSETLTKAAKQFGMAQPSLSQQLGKLEANIGTLLFHRRSNEMVLTEAGQFLLPRAESMLRKMRELEDGLSQFSEGQRQTIRLAGISSVLRVILPDAVAAMQASFPEIEFDLQDSAPADILELLYGRRVTIGLLAANSVAQAGVGFSQTPLMDDPYVLAVPESLDLEGVGDTQSDLDQRQQALLNQSIQFMFGSQHSNRVADWFDRMLPRHRVVAQCRSFDTAIGLVQAGAGVCLMPALATMSGQGPMAGVNLYLVKAPPRRIVALVPSQYRHSEPHASLLHHLQARGSSYVAPGLLPTPPFLASETAEDF